MSEQDSTMPPTPNFSLTLIVATTPTLGIGLRGALPWRLRSEMQYFARVTQRVPPSYIPAPSQHSSSTQQQQERSVQNAVIMGRKTWESIPPKFRPLKNRLNVVLSRSKEWSKGAVAAGVDGELVCAESLGEAVDLLSRRFVGSSVSLGSNVLDTSKPLSSSSSSSSSNIRGSHDIARAFVIGGAEVYRAALEMPETDTVLLTRVHGDWECDTFFPVDLDKDVRWERKSFNELKDWTCEESVPEGVITEGNVEFEYSLYSRR